MKFIRRADRQQRGSSALVDYRRGPAGVYNRSKYERQMREALTNWSNHVAALIEGRPAANVVPMHG